MKDARGHGSNARGGATPGNQLRDQARAAINRALAIAPGAPATPTGDIVARARSAISGALAIAPGAHSIAARHGIPIGHLASAWHSVKRAFRNSDG